MKEKLWFVFIGMALIIIGFDVLTAVHYGNNLAGLILMAAVGCIALGSFLAFFCAWFAVRRDNFVLKICAFVGKSILIVVGGLSAAAIITLYFHEKGQQQQQQATIEAKAAESDADVQKINAAKEAEVQRINALKDASIELRKKAGMRAARAFIEKNAGATATPTPENQTGTALAAAQTLGKTKEAESQKSGIKIWLLEYAQSGIYVVPIVANVLVFLGISLVLMFIPTGTGTTINNYPPPQQSYQNQNAIPAKPQVGFAAAPEIQASANNSEAADEKARRAAICNHFGITEERLQLLEASAAHQKAEEEKRRNFQKPGKQ